MRLAEAAPAKVNLHLHVTGRRADGYHLLDSLVVFAEAGDLLEVEPADDLTLEVTGPQGAGLATEPDNLVLRAARLLADSAGVAPRARLRLTKNLPVASGIGGGSADAAAALRLLARLWEVPLPPADAVLRLGADVPVCLRGQPCVMGGIGEVLTPAPTLPPAGLLLANPGVAVPTPAVFKARTGPFSPPAKLPPSWRDAPAMARDLAALTNDLEAPARLVAPMIGEVLAALAALPGALLSRMSGSGATCFALFENPAAARAAAATLNRPGWWISAGGLAAPAPAA